jgi:uncharacterized protein YmfQ (DUF2313 family)
LKQCDWCGNYYTANVPYQVYCTTTCRDEATKQKISDRQRFLKRQRRNGKVRLCQGNCGTRLSIYNDSNVCDNCSINKKEVQKRIKEIKVFMHEYEDNTKEY